MYSTGKKRPLLTWFFFFFFKVFEDRKTNSADVKLIILFLFSQKIYKAFKFHWNCLLNLFSGKKKSLKKKKNVLCWKVYSACYMLTLKAPITTIVVCFVFCQLLCHCCKQCGPRSDCSFRSCLIWVHTVCRYAKIGLKSLQEHSADDINRQHFQMQIFLVL